MKFEKQIFASAAAAALMFNASLSGAETPESAALKLPRKDIPWVSLKHQRELEAKAIDAAVKTAEQRAEEERKRKELERQSSFLSRFTKESAPKVTADKFDYAQDGSGKLSASGKVVVEDKNFIVNADFLEYSPKGGYALIEGNVGVSIPEARIAADKIRLDISNDAMQSDYSKFGSYPVFIEAQSLSGDKKNVELKDATTYFGEPSWCSMKTKASNIKYNTETELLEMDDVTLMVGDVPFMYVPSYSQHGLKKPPFNLRNRFGLNDDYGAYISNTVYYNGLEDVSPGMLLDYYTKRSVLFGPAVEYDYSGVETWLSGWAQGAYINDHGNKDILGYDSLGRPIEHDRFFAEFRHSQMVSDSVSLTGNVSYWSDEFVTRDFRPELFYDNQTPDNFGEAMYYGNFFTASVFTRFAPNDWELVQQRLPEVRFDMQPVEILNTGAYQNFFVSYAYLRESDPYELSSEYINSNRIDAYYGISRPIQLNSWSKFTPVIGGRLTYYANPTDNRGSYTRMLGQIGFDAQMDIWGHFDYKSKTMGIDGIRHHITPVVSYRYIPNAEQGEGAIPVIDSNYLTTYPPILDLGTLRNVDQIYNTNTMRFGIQNVFETRDEDYVAREIARFDVYQDINFTKRPLPQQIGEQSFSDLYINASISPARWLTVGTYTRVNIDHMDIPEVNTYLGLFDGDEASAYFVSSYLKGQITQYALLCDYRLSERYRLIGRWYYDARLNMLTEQTYGLWTRMGNSWIVEYLISQRSGSTRQNNFSFGVRVNMAIF